MMNRLSRTIYVTAMAIMILPSCGIAQLQVVFNIEETFEGIEEIVVDGGSLEVTYEGSDQTEVFLSAYLESSKNSGQEITYKVEGTRLRVTYKRAGSSGWGNLRSKGFISLVGPEDIAIKMTNSSGKMFVSNVIGDQIDLKISSGNIEARNLSSDRINLIASSGKIDIENVNGTVECNASSGGGRISKVS